MKLLEYKQFNNSENEERSLNKKKVAVTASISVSILFIIIIVIIYNTSIGFRNFVDQYILFKHVNEKDLASINIESDRNIHTYAFYNYVVILENNKLKFLNSSGKEIPMVLDNAFTREITLDGETSIQYSKIATNLKYAF